MKNNNFVLTDDNYYTPDANKIFCSASQWKDIIGCPFLPGCEARAMATINGEWEPEQTKALLIGSVLDSLWEGLRGDELAEKYPDCTTKKGELKADFKKCIELYERTYRDKKFRAYMSGDKQVIMTGEIDGLPFKIKMDSYIEGKAIVDLKTTQDASMDFRKYVADLGQRLPFYIGFGYDIQLAIYREIVRQNTGDTLKCYIAAIDKKDHPLPMVIEFDDKLLDDALEQVKRHCGQIIALKNGEIEPLRCDSGDCDYCRDTYECKVVTTSEFESHDMEGA